MSNFNAPAQSTTRPGPAGGAGRPRHARDGLVLALACVAQFMVVLDVSIVTVALPSIGRDLHYSPAGLQWVVNAYVLTFAGFLLAWLPESRGRAPGDSAPRLDLGGAIAVTAGLGALIYAIVGTQTYPWGSARTLSLLGAAAVLLAAFAVIELRLVRTPLMPFSLLRSRSVSGANTVMLLIGTAFFSMWYFLSLYLQNALGYSALRTGLAFLPMGMAIIAGAQASSRLLPRTGVRPLLQAGTLLAAGGFGWLSAITPHASYWVHVFGPGCLISLALGLLFTPLAAAATAGVPFSEAGLASGVLNTSRQVGGSLGLAVLATIATDRSHAVLAAVRPAASLAAGLNDGYSRAFEWAAALCVAAFAASLVVPAIRGRRPASGSGR